MGLSVHDDLFPTPHEFVSWKKRSMAPSSIYDIPHTLSSVSNRALGLQSLCDEPQVISNDQCDHSKKKTLAGVVESTFSRN